MTRYCLWGGRRGSVQIGSQSDQRLQAFARLLADVRRSLLSRADAFVALGRAFSGEAR